jgi:hypothetical protein
MMNHNPDPSLFAESVEGFILKPRQCPMCKNLYTPHTIMQVICFDCNMPVVMPERVLIPFHIDVEKKMRDQLMLLRARLCQARKRNDNDTVNFCLSEINKISIVDKRKKENRKNG